MAKRVAKPFDGSDAILSINAFIPGYPPEEIKIKIPNFRGKAFGKAATIDGFKQDLLTALKGKYGNKVT